MRGRNPWAELMDLEKVKLGHSPLTNNIYLYRYGKDPNVALDKRDAESDVMSVLVQYMMYNAPEGSEKTIYIGDKKYNVMVTPA